MQTFIKKLSRDSEFAVVFPAILKQKYALDPELIISFSVFRRDNGVVVLSKTTLVGNSNEDSEIVFSLVDLDFRSNNGEFQDFTIYDYRIIVYSQLEGEANPITQFFGKCQILTDKIFGLTEDSQSRIHFYFNGGMFTTAATPLGTSELGYYFDPNTDFIVPNEILIPENVVCTGFDPTIVAHGSSSWLSFSDVEYSSNSDSGFFYVPKSELSSTNTFVMQRDATWKYGVCFNYIKDEVELELGMNGLGETAPFENSSYASETPYLTAVFDYFNGFNFVTSESGTPNIRVSNAKTFGALCDALANTTDNRLEFFNKDYYEKATIDLFYLTGVARYDESSSSYSVIPIQTTVPVGCDRYVDVMSQINNIVGNLEGSFELLKGDVLLFNVGLTAKQVTLQLGIRDIDASDESSAPYDDSVVSVHFTVEGYQESTRLEDISVNTYAGGILQVCAEEPLFVSEDNRLCIGYALGEEASSRVYHLDELTDFVFSEGTHFFDFLHNGATNNFLARLEMQYADVAEFEDSSAAVLQPVFLEAEPFVLRFTLSDEFPRSLALGANPRVVYVNQQVDSLYNAVLDLKDEQELAPDEEESSFTVREGSSSSSEVKVIQIGVRLPATVNYGNGVITAGGVSSLPAGEQEVSCIGYETVTLNGLLSSGMRSLVSGMEVVQWGDFLTNADRLFGGLNPEFSGNALPWSDFIVSASATYWLSNCSGTVPAWNNVRNADRTYGGCKNLVGAIPPWGNVESAISTYYGCSGLTSIWDRTASVSDIMPPNLKHDALTVKETGTGVRAYFAPSWGGFAGSEEWDKPTQTLEFLFELPAGNITTDLRVTGRWLSIYWDFDNIAGPTSFTEETEPGWSGIPRATHRYKYELETPKIFRVHITSGISSGMPNTTGAVIQAEVTLGAGKIYTITSTPDMHNQFCQDTIWDYAPGRCTAGYGPLRFSVPKDNLNRVFLGPGTIRLEQEDFKNYTNLVRVDDLHPVLGKCGNNVFMGCTSLKEVNLAALNIIGDNCFQGCTSLEKAVTNGWSLGQSCFAGCRRLSYLRLHCLGSSSTGQLCSMQIASTAFENVGADLTPDEDGITTDIVLAGTLRGDVRNYTGFPWGASPNVRFVCDDGDIVAIDGSFHTYVDHIEVESEPEEKTYYIVSHSNDWTRISPTGLSVKAHYVGDNGTTFVEDITWTAWRTSTVLSNKYVGSAIRFTFSNGGATVGTQITGYNVVLTDITTSGYFIRTFQSTATTTNADFYPERVEDGYFAISHLSNFRIQGTYTIQQLQGYNSRGSSRSVIVDLGERKLSDDETATLYLDTEFSDTVSFYFNDYGKSRYSKWAYTYDVTTEDRWHGDDLFGKTVYEVTIGQALSYFRSFGISEEICRQVDSTRYLLKYVVKTEIGNNVLGVHVHDAAISGGVAVSQINRLVFWMPFDLVDFTGTTTDYSEYLGKATSITYNALIKCVLKDIQTDAAQGGKVVFEPQMTTSVPLRFVTSSQTPTQTVVGPQMGGGTSSVEVAYRNWFFPSYQGNVYDKNGNYRYKFGYYAVYTPNDTNNPLSEGTFEPASFTYEEVLSTYKWLLFYEPDKLSKVYVNANGGLQNAFTVTTAFWLKGKKYDMCVQCVLNFTYLKDGNKPWQYSFLETHNTLENLVIQCEAQKMLPLGCSGKPGQVPEAKSLMGQPVLVYVPPEYPAPEIYDENGVLLGIAIPVATRFSGKRYYTGGRVWERTWDGENFWDIDWRTQNPTWYLIDRNSALLDAENPQRVNLTRRDDEIICIDPTQAIVRYTTNLQTVKYGNGYTMQATCVDRDKILQLDLKYLEVRHFNGTRILDDNFAGEGRGNVIYQLNPNACLLQSDSDDCQNNMQMVYGVVKHNYEDATIRILVRSNKTVDELRKTFNIVRQIPLSEIPTGYPNGYTCGGTPLCGYKMVYICYRADSSCGV